MVESTMKQTGFDQLLTTIKNKLAVELCKN